MANGGDIKFKVRVDTSEFDAAIKRTRRTLGWFRWSAFICGAAGGAVSLLTYWALSSLWPA